MFYIFLLSILHAFHLSTSEINYDEKSNSIQIATKVFIDDLELELSREGVTDLKIGTKKEKEVVDSILGEYFKKRLNIVIDNVRPDSYYLGKELSDDLIAIWAYIEIPLENIPSHIKIDNTILTNVFDDQKNIVIIKKNNKLLKHTFLDKDEQSISLSL